MSSEKKFESAPNVAESSQSDTQSIRSEDMVPYELKRKQNIKELGQLFPKENLPSSSTVIQPPQKNRVAIQPPSRKSSRIAEKYLKIQKRTAWKKRDADSWLNPTTDMSSWRDYMEERDTSKGLNVRCDECMRRFRAASYLKAHKRAEHQNLPFPCDFPGCDAEYAWVHKLVDHKLKHH